MDIILSGFWEDPCLLASDIPLFLLSSFSQFISPRIHIFIWIGVNEDDAKANNIFLPSSILIYIHSSKQKVKQKPLSKISYIFYISYQIQFLIHSILYSPTVSIILLYYRRV